MPPRTRRSVIAFLVVVGVAIAITVWLGSSTESPSPSPPESAVVPVNVPQPRTPSPPVALPSELPPSPTPDAGERSDATETTLEATVRGGLSTELVRAKQSTLNQVVVLRCTLANERCTLRITPGAWMLSVVQEGRPTTERPFTVLEGPNHVTLERASTSTTVVRVLDGTGVVTGASVWREDEDREDEMVGLPSGLHITESLVGKSDARGEVSLALVAGDTVKIRATAPGFLDSKEVEVRSSDSSATLTLTKVPTIRGRVVRDDGSAVNVFSIDGKQFDASDGRFAVPSAFSGERGTQFFTFKSPGLVSVTRDVDLAGLDLDIGDVVLARGQTIRGRVLDAQTSQPLSGALVHGNGATSVVANTLGEFELVEQPKGSVQVFAHASEHAPASALSSEAGNADVIIRLGPAVSVSGRILNPGLSKYVIAVGPSVEVVKLDGSSFHFDTLAPGHWTFSHTHFDVLRIAKQGLPMQQQSELFKSLTQHGFKTPLDVGQTAVTNFEVR